MPVAVALYLCFTGPCGVSIHQRLKAAQHRGYCPLHARGWETTLRVIISETSPEEHPSLVFGRHPCFPPTISAVRNAEKKAKASSVRITFVFLFKE